MELDIKPIIVTALFDIGRDKWTNFTQSYGGYLDWMERTLAIQTPMVIFTEEQFVEEIKKRREKYFDKTEIVITTKEDLIATKLYYSHTSRTIGSIEFRKKVQFDVPEMNKPWYNILMINKIYWLEEATKVLDGTHYIWTDAGCYREDIEQTNKPFPTHKIGDKPIFFSHHNTISIENKEHHILSQMRFIQGGSFILPKESITDISKELHGIVRDYLLKGYTGSDEKFLDILYLQGPEKYELVKCDWREYMKVMS
jgi:hypothetical protein